ncbi:MAG: hypothetical protein PVJ32_00805 [Anaerolineales bacterium]|jgi:hypothetical protein
METFTEARDFVDNPLFAEQRTQSLQSLDLSAIDAPIRDIVADFAKLSYCYTLQICLGHFVYPGQNDPQNLDPLPISSGIKEVEYRIAYLALCIEDSKQGRSLFQDLAKIASKNPECIQFGSADWFWDRQVNTYAIQVEPARFMFQDSAVVDYQEAIVIQKVRDDFFKALRALLMARLS